MRACREHGGSNGGGVFVAVVAVSVSAANTTTSPLSLVCSASELQLDASTGWISGVLPGFQLTDGSGTQLLLATGAGLSDVTPCSRGSSSTSSHNATTLAVNVAWTCGVSLATTTDVFSCHGSGAISWATHIESNSTTHTALELRSELRLAVATPSRARFWAAASVPAFTTNGTAPAVDPLSPFGAQWPSDPSIDLLYGGVMMDPFCPNNGSAVNHSVLGTPFPLATVLLPPGGPSETGGGMSLIGSGDDDTVYLFVSARRHREQQTNRSVSLRRYHFRVGGAGSRPGGVHFNQFIATHAADWRPAVGWIQTLNPSKIEAPSTAAAATATQVVGSGGAYANFRGGKLNTTFLDRAGFGFNWDASFPWEVLGTPFPVSIDDARDSRVPFETCTPHSFRGAPGNCDGCDPTLPTHCDDGLTMPEVGRWYSELAAQGNFTTLTYFNVFELGQDIRSLNAPPGGACSNTSAMGALQTGLNFSQWTQYVDCKYNELVRGHLRSAVVRCWNDDAPSCPRQGPNGTTTGIVQSAFNAVVLDPGEWTNCP